MNDTMQIRRGPGSARDFLAVLFRRRWIIGTVFAVTTLTVVGINFSQPLFYESTGKVIVKRGVRDNIMQGYTRTMGWEEELASEVETVKSGAVLGMAQDYLDEQRAVRNRPTTRIAADRVEASVIGESNVIAMSYQDREPEVAQEVTEAVIHAYMEYRKNEYTLKFPKEFFDSELSRVSRELAEWTAKREAYMAATGTVNLHTEGVADKDFVRQQELDLVDIEKEMAQKRQALTDMKALLASAQSPADVPFQSSPSSGNDLIITEIKKDLTDARVRFREMENIYVPQSRELQNMRSKIVQLEGMLATEVNTRIRIAEADVRALEAKAASVRRAQSTGESRLATYPARTARMGEIEMRIAALTKNYNELTESAAQAKIAKATSPDWTVDLLTPAGRPYAKNQRDYVRLALAPIFSVIIGLGLAFFIDGLDASLKSPRETEEALELPVLASLTEHKERRA
jgi:succinoglycan biosynthesis transport protein ExoP